MLSARAFAIAAASPCALAGAGAAAPSLAAVWPPQAASAQAASSAKVVRVSDLMMMTFPEASGRISSSRQRTHGSLAPL
jgi:hypothetical protein